MKRRYAAVVLSLLVSSCSREEVKPNANAEGALPTVITPVVMDAAAARMAVASIASVQMSQDCPDPKPAFNAELIPASGPRASTPQMDAKRGAFMQPCTQSAVQIAFKGKGAASATVKIGTVRLKSADGKELAKLRARGPSLWKEGGYKSWDGVLAADSDEQASYKLSVPEWSALETALGRSSYGQMYVLELEVDIGGVVSTITSPQFERAQALMIQT